MSSIKGIAFKKNSGKNLRIGIVKAHWNSAVTDNLLAGCVESLLKSGVKRKNIFVVEVPGSFELPLGAKHLIKTKKVHVVVAIGCLLKGETKHFDNVADATAHGLMRIMLDTDTPVLFGVLPCLNEQQAIARSTGENNEGIRWGFSAVEMGLLKKKKN